MKDMVTVIASIKMNSVKFLQYKSSWAWRNLSPTKFSAMQMICANGKATDA